MKILILSRFTRKGASSRLRLYQYLPYLEAQGFSCSIHPLLNDQYLEELYDDGAVSKWNVAKCYLRTARKILRAGKYDLILIEKEIFPFLPAWAEAWLNFRKVPYFVDYDDAVFHTYDQHLNSVVRFFLGNKIKKVMRRATAVICGNEYLAAYAQDAAKGKVYVIPTVIEHSRYRPKVEMDKTEVVIGWIGSPSSAQYLKDLKPVFEDLLNRYPVKIHIIGASGLGLGDREEVLTWTEASEAALVQRFDIGIMPLKNSPWERGKCGYKLIQYMGCGLPVVGSPIGVNEDLIQEGENGFKPINTTQWKEALERLVLAPELRSSMGKAGRRLVEERYNLDVAFKSWKELICSYTSLAC